VRSSSALSDRSKVEQPVKPTEFACKACKQRLFTSENVINHSKPADYDTKTLAESKAEGTLSVFGTIYTNRDQ
jgi:hypothetical protein